MATPTPTPFTLIEKFLDSVSGKVQPPAWATEEAQRRLVLLLNHILMQEPEAQARLLRQKGRIVQARWRALNLRLEITPAGLLALAPAVARADLTLTLLDESPFALARNVLRGDKPATAIEGDVQLAAEVGWLIDHVRWDIEEDIARVLGDPVAHALGQAARSLASALRQLTQKVNKGR